MIRSERRFLEPAPRQSGHVEFVRLWTGASRRVYAYIFTVVLNWTDAEDLLQEVGVTAWEKFDEFDRDRDFVAWACGIARNKVLTFNQLASHRLIQSPELLEKIELVARSQSQTLDQQYDALHHCLARLNQADRNLMQARYAPETSMKEIAVQSGRSVQGLYKAVQKIRARLFDCVMRRMSRGGGA